MTSLLSNPFFWLGQIGLLATIIACQAIIEVRRHVAKQPYINSLWLMSGLGLWCMGTPLTGGHPLPVPLYLLELGTGTVFVLGYFQVRATPGLVVSKTNTATLRKILFGLGGGGLLVICAISLIVAYQEHKVLAGQESKRTAAILDTRMKARNDSLTAEILTNRAQGEKLTLKVNEQAEQIDRLTLVIARLTDIIVSLKRSVVRVDANVERSRKAIPNLQKVTSDTLPMLVAPPTLHYVTPPPKKH